MTPEEKARQEIDAQLGASGWCLQNYKELNLGAAPGIAVCEVPLKSGPCDYLLIVNRIPIGVIEAKKKGTTLSAVADQSGRGEVGGVNGPPAHDLVPSVHPAKSFHRKTI